MPLLFPDILFTESNHSYVNKKTLQRYTSVTTILKSYMRPFQKEFWLHKKSKELGINRFELEKIWSDKSITGSTAGSILHLYIENKMKNKIIEPIYNVPEDCIEETKRKFEILKPQADNFINDFESFGYNIEQQEAILQMNNLCGQADMLCSDDKGQWIIFDFKTDKQLKTPSERMLGDLKHLRNHTIVKHGLQLSLYQRMLEEIDINVVKRIIVWFCETADNYQLIEVPYYENEANLILNSN